MSGPRSATAAPRALGALVTRLAGEGRLRALAGGGPGLGGDDRELLDDLVVSAITDDSRRVTPGSVFVAIRGLRTDGHDFVAEAARHGALAVVVEHSVSVADGPSRGDPEAIPGPPIEIVVDRSAAALASAAAWWYDDPSSRLSVVGVTGTNGKTTTTFLAGAGLEAVGRRVGLSTTVGVSVVGHLEANSRPMTTPGAMDLQALLRRMVDAGDDTAVIETSSHGLAADRVASIAYDAAIFTTLGQEHLDFHGTMAAYLAAKRSLFERLPRLAKDGRPGLGVVNLDDPAADEFLAATRGAGALAVTYGTATDADIRLLTASGTARGVEARFAIRGDAPRELRLRVGGRYNARNALAVVGLGVGWGLPIDAVVAGLAELRGVPGRLELVDHGQPFTVVVDFAHTSGSIEALLAEVRAGLGPRGRVAVVFGASGERDEGKRPLMGEAAVRGADLTVITEDDPRGEDLGAILASIEAGARRAGGRRGVSYEVVPSRSEAIEVAIRWAKPGDVVVLAGKGHETWMARRDGLGPWDDRVEAARVLAAVGYPDPAG